MPSGDYTAEERERINLYLNKILEILKVRSPDDHYGGVQIYFPREAGKVAGDVEVSFRSKHKLRRAG
ncbi:MAG: hypothetical protein HUU02_07950 [Bacteroidetes bacterium]|jgi:hypothetical protein|nr:hypothetical protein [Bacteroidota bacterium]